MSVYQGSVIVNFQIAEDSKGTLAKVGGLASVESSLTQQLSKNLINLGAPILSVSVTTTNASVASSSKTSTSTGTTTTQTTTTTPSSTPTQT